jgi:peptidylprolyl isomerase
VRKTSALFVTAALALSLTACAGDPGYSGCGQYGSGDASSIVDVTGKVGAAPKVDFPTPIVTRSPQASEIVAGDGERMQAGQPVRVEMGIYYGSTGAELQSTPFDGNGVMTMVGDSTLPAVGHALECATVGSRLVVTTPAKDVFNLTTIGQLGVDENDSFVFVVDVLDAYLAKADGTPQAPGSGNPVVVTAPNGAPGITIPQSGGSSVKPPKDLVVSVLQRGDGEKLKEGSHAVVHYTGVLWDTNKVFDSTWKNNSAAVFRLSADSVVKGFLDGLVGQRIGSQVLLVVPPELGYGDTGNGSVPAGSTLVFVVDVLGQINQK